MKKVYRIILYCVGLIIIALGLILNTKAGLGVSPIISIPYSISIMWNVNFGNATLCMYILCVIGQMLLRRKRFRLFDLMQFPMSVIFSRMINFFNNNINITLNGMLPKLLLLIAAVILTGIGAAITVEMKCVPNAPDGLAQAMSESMKKDLGFAKNILDLSCAAFTVIISLIFAGKVIGIGIGTVVAMLGVGRVIYVFNIFFKDKMDRLVYNINYIA